MQGITVGYKVSLYPLPSLMSRAHNEPLMMCIREHPTPLYSAQLVTTCMTCTCVVLLSLSVVKPLDARVHVYKVVIAYKVIRT